MCAEKRKDEAPSGRLKRSAHSVDIETDFPSTVLSFLPREYQIIGFPELAAYEDYKNKCILGVIKYAYPVCNRPRNGHLRKLLLVDAMQRSKSDGNEPVLTVFLFDAFAEASAKHGKGSMVAISNFHVEELVFMDPEDDFEVLNVQVLAMVSPTGDDGPQVWFAHRRAISNRNEIPTDQPVRVEGSNNHAIEDMHLEVAEEFSGGEDGNENGQVSNGVSEPVPETDKRCYQYTKLGDLSESGEKPKYNVYGIIQSCSMHLNKIRKSYNLYLHLCDETESDFACTLFGGKTEDLIDANVGDVIRIHRLMVDKVRGKLMGKCLKPTFAVVFNKDTKEKEPKSVAKTFVYTEEDKSIVKKLFVWYEITKRKPICEIKREEFANIFCQVIGVYVAKTLNAVVLTVWDGTRTTEFESEHRSYTDERVDHELFNIAKDYFATIFVYGNHGLVAAELQPKDFIEVKDVQLHCSKCNPEKPLLSLHPQQKGDRGIYLLDPSDDRLDNLKRRLAKITEDVTRDPSYKDSEKDNFFLNSNVIGTSLHNHKGKTIGSSSGEQEKSQDHIISAGTILEAHHPVLASEEKASNDGYNEEKNKSPSKSSTVSVNTSQLSFDDQQNISRPKKDTLLHNAGASGTSSISEVDAVHVTGHVSSRSNGDVISIVNAGIEPGHSTQEFGGFYQEPNKRIQQSVTSVPASVSFPSNVPVPSTSQQSTRFQLNQTPNNLLQPTQFQAYGPPAKYSIFGNPQPTPEIIHEDVADEWWKNFSTVTETLGHSRVKPTKLIDVSNHSVPYKFRVIAAALKVKPEATSIRKLIRLYCPHCHHLTQDSDPNAEVVGEKNGLPLYKCPKSPHVSQSGQLLSPLMMYTYVVTFSLHDGSEVNIDAFLWQENGVNFFRGITPEQALLDDALANSVFSMLWTACPNARPSGSLGLPSTSQNGGFSLYPLLDCCIKSYTASGMTRYHMFDTAVIQNNTS